ncbi:GTPase IMAP family member 8-like [Carassius carassius]|uniref:GTPase IMAP family member 8-like n=1 Tax=Carassius carassius TaxID=217509 RepID=UPI002868E1AF|nr:GTPase IMAP family member 8-like [Carassius carassius]
MCSSSRVTSVVYGVCVSVVSGSPSELCLVLVGSISCGKTLTADTLLGQSSAPGPSASSRVSQIRSGVSEGRRLTIVETPRWYWRGQQVEDHIQEETLRFLGSSAPGPFVLLFLIPIGEFTEVERRIPDQLERMFGPSVLAHTLVLLTCGEYLMERGVEQYLGKEAGLQEVVRRCHGRCHVIRNRRPDDRQQVLALLEKVEQMMQRNGGFHLETHRRGKQTLINTLEETGSDVMIERRLTNGLQCEETDGRHTPLEKSLSFKLNRVHQSLNTVWDGGDPLDCCSDPLDDSSLPELRLVLLGRCGSGKTAAGNIILGGDEFDLMVDSERCVKARALVEDTRVSVVDTPDWFLSERSPEEVRAQTSSCVALLAPGPHVFLLCVPVDRPAHSELLALSRLEATFGTDAIRRHTMVLFTRSELLPDAAQVEQVEEYIASQKTEMLELVQRCGDRYHILQSGGAKELLEKVQQTVKESGEDFYSTSLFQQNQILTVRRDRDRLNPSRSLDALEEEEASTAPAPARLRSVWPTASRCAGRVPKLLTAGALTGAVLGVFLAGAVGGALGAVLGSVLTEVCRQTLNKHKTE